TRCASPEAAVPLRTATLTDGGAAAATCLGCRAVGALLLLEAPLPAWPPPPTEVTITSTAITPTATSAPTASARRRRVCRSRDAGRSGCKIGRAPDGCGGGSNRGGACTGEWCTPETRADAPSCVANGAAAASWAGNEAAPSSSTGKEAAPSSSTGREAAPPSWAAPLPAAGVAGGGGV